MAKQSFIFTKQIIENTCKVNNCQNGGSCVVMDGAQCNCPIGYLGQFCELSIFIFHFSF